MKIGIIGKQCCQMYINVSIDLLYKKITSMIAYFAVETKYNLTRKEFRAAVTGICVSQGCVFPAHISLGMRVSPHTYH